MESFAARPRSTADVSSICTWPATSSGLTLHYGDLTDSSSLMCILQAVQPDEIYNLAAQSHVKVSFEVPEYTAEVDAVGTLRLLEAVRNLGLKARIYQASTSELFGKVVEVPQKETTPFYPRSPYGVAKQYGYWITKNYREAYGLFAVNGILLNRECRTNSTLAIWTPGGTGAMPRIMWSACGSCCSIPFRRIS